MSVRAYGYKILGLSLILSGSFASTYSNARFVPTQVCQLPGSIVAYSFFAFFLLFLMSMAAFVMTKRREVKHRRSKRPLLHYIAIKASIVLLVLMLIALIAYLFLPLVTALLFSSYPGC
ncbi:MAG: hypothetical protein KGH67_02290 [Candidatus Micrarchaeota archaeon]|nr:hypothetical protein [Candidatus Micrarchaeota archaeon]